MTCGMIGGLLGVGTANDSRGTNVGGVAGPAKDPPPDTASIIDVAQHPAKVVTTVGAPANVIGARPSIWIVVAAPKLDPGAAPAAICTSRT
jgi:hypothetical protein